MMIFTIYITILWTNFIPFSNIPTQA